MKLERNYKGEYRQGIILVWMFEAEGFVAEYSADAFNYDNYETTKEIETLFPYTDGLNLESIAYVLVNKFCLDIDMFETVVLKDAFLATLKVLMLEGKISEDKIQHINEWYFSENPKYKILENDKKAWEKWSFK